MTYCSATSRPSSRVSARITSAAPLRRAKIPIGVAVVTSDMPASIGACTWMSWAACTIRRRASSEATDREAAGIVSHAGTIANTGPAAPPPVACA